MKILYDDYFIPGLERGDTEVLLHKVFFDIMFHTARRGKEGLHNLDKDSFVLKKSADNREYIEITFNEVTKKNQGDNTSSGADSLHNNHTIIVAQEGSVKCPVNSFKHYVSNMHPECNAFFQYPNESKTGYDKKPIGKNTLGSLMKTISEKAKLSKIYTNHCIRKTTATGLHHQGFNLKEIANVTKHKNLQSREHYIGGPTHGDKENYYGALFDYANNENIDAKDGNKRKSSELETVQPKKKQALKQNVTAENAIIPLEPNFDDEEDGNMMAKIPLSQNVVQNQLRQAANMFQNATFTNCTITFQMPK